MPYQKKYEKFVSVIKNNERIQSEFFEIKKIILRKHSLNELLPALLKELQERFSLMHVGITFIGKNIGIEKDRLKEITNHKKIPVISIDDPQSIRFLIKNSKPRLQNKNIEMWSDLFTQKIISKAGSVAVVPLSLDGKVIGTINLADASRERYNPKRATLFLENLAVIVSICVNNVITHEQLRHIAITDPLTGLANRRHVYSVLDRAFRNYRRYGSDFSLLYVDLDDFKGINDQFGHDVGDLYLKHAAKILLGQCRDSDCVSRFGGDEFVIALCRSNLTDALKTKTRIEQKLFSSPLVRHSTRLHMLASFGVASTENHKTHSVDDLLKEADCMLYEDKKGKAQRLQQLSVAM